MISREIKIQAHLELPKSGIRDGNTLYLHFGRVFLYLLGGLHRLRSQRLWLGEIALRGGVPLLANRAPGIPGVK